MIMWFLFLILFVWCIIYIYWLVYVEPFLHPWNETNLIMMCDLFNVLLNLVHKYFIENFFIFVHHPINWSIIFFVIIQCWYQCWLCGMSLVVFFPFLFHGIIWVALLLIWLKVWQNSTVTSSHPGLFFVGRLYYFFILIAYYRSV
jgi:hypothetical protein